MLTLPFVMLGLWCLSWVGRVLPDSVIDFLAPLGTNEQQQPCSVAHPHDHNMCHHLESNKACITVGAAIWMLQLLFTTRQLAEATEPTINVHIEITVPADRARDTQRLRL
jgi:hypothetical protein